MLDREDRAQVEDIKYLLRRIIELQERQLAILEKRPRIVNYDARPLTVERVADPQIVEVPVRVPSELRGIYAPAGPLVRKGQAPRVQPVPAEFLAPGRGPVPTVRPPAVQIIQVDRPKSEWLEEVAARRAQRVEPLEDDPEAAALDEAAAKLSAMHPIDRQAFLEDLREKGKLADLRKEREDAGLPELSDDELRGLLGEPE